MLFDLKLNKDIISIPSFPARLRRIRKDPNDESNKIFEYQITLNVDLAKSFSLMGLMMEIEVLPRKPTKFSKKPKTVAPQTFARSTKTLEKSRRAASKRRKSNTITTRNVDLTRYANNSTAKKSTADCESMCRRSRGASRRSCMKLCRGMKSRAIEELFSPRMVSTRSPFESSRFTLAQSSSVSLSDSVKYPNRKLSVSVINNKVEPGQLLYFPLQRLPAQLGAQAKSIMFTPPPSEQKPSIYRVRSSVKEVKFGLRIRSKALKGRSKFYLNARLINNKGVLLDEVGQTVNHARFVNDYITPRKPPFLEANAIKPGINSVAVKQVDKRATRLKVFRRTAPTDGARGSRWVEVLDTSATAVQDEIRFKDATNSSNITLYRAVAIGENSRAANRFTSAVVMPLKEIRTTDNDMLTCVAKYNHSSNNISIKVSDIPSDVISVSVKKYDITTDSYAKKRSGAGQGFEYVGDNEAAKTKWVAGDTDGMVTFNDKKVKRGRKYRYVPIAVTKTGREVSGTDSLVEVYANTSDDARVSLDVSSPVLALTDTDASVTFSLAAEFTEFGFDEVRSSLEAARQGVLFADDVFDERDKFSSLINFLVERENYTTGITESFGVYEAGEFSDNSSVRLEKNISQPQRGEKYAYKVTALLRSADSILQDLLQPSIDQTTLLRFQQNISKFRNPLAMGGTLQSTARQTDFSKPSGLEPTDPFLAGRTNVEASYEVTIPSSTATQGTVAVDIRANSVLVTWSYSGNASRLDHFQVFVCSQGGEQMIGVIHPDPDNVEYQFRHFTEGYSVPYFYEIRSIRANYVSSGRVRSRNIQPTRYRKSIRQVAKGKKVVQL